MMPLIFADDGEVNIIRSIGGTEEIPTNGWRRKL